MKSVLHVSTRSEVIRWPLGRPYLASIQVISCSFSESESSLCYRINPAAIASLGLHRGMSRSFCFVCASRRCEQTLQHVDHRMRWTSSEPSYKLRNRTSMDCYRWLLFSSGIGTSCFHSSSHSLTQRSFSHLTVFTERLISSCSHSSPLYCWH